MKINKLSITFLLVSNFILSIQSFTLREYIAKVDQYQKTLIDARKNFEQVKTLLNEIYENAKNDIINNKLLKAYLAKNNFLSLNYAYSNNEEATESLDSTVKQQLTFIDKVLNTINF